VVQDDGHINDPESLSSFKFGLSVRSAAPRIEAHYQYYNTSVEPSMMAAQDAVCPVWVYMDGKQYCSPDLERSQQNVGSKEYVHAILKGLVWLMENQGNQGVAIRSYTWGSFGR
jgi:UDP-glucose:glycoprotein glucosyltransferase